MQPTTEEITSSTSFRDIGVFLASLAIMMFSIRSRSSSERKCLEKEREEPIAAANVVKGLDHVLKLTVVKMRNILVHYYGENKTVMNKLRRPEIESLIRDKMNADPIQPEPTQTNQTQTNATPTDPIQTEPTRTQPNRNELNRP